MSNNRSKNSRGNGNNSGKGPNNKARGANRAGGGNRGSSAGNGSKGSGRQTNSRRRKGSKKKQVDPRVFWGDSQQLPANDEIKTTITANPSAVVKSLGRAPLSGQQNAAELYFTAVYDRAVNLAAALAAAGNLIEADDLAGDDSFG